MTRMLPLAACAALLLAGCASHPASDATASASTPAGARVDMATVVLAPASGSTVSGKLMLMSIDGGVRLTGEIGGFPPNSTHGFHVHETGDCSAVDASSAGGHFNPAAKPHGRASMPQHHAGDNDNLVADANGVARVDARFADLALGGGGAGDAIGKAVIVHASPDDYTSQPSGNAGARLACGVITAP